MQILFRGLISNFYDLFFRFSVVHATRAHKKLNSNSKKYCIFKSRLLAATTDTGKQHKKLQSEQGKLKISSRESSGMLIDKRGASCKWISASKSALNLQSHDSSELTFHCTLKLFFSSFFPPFYSHSFMHFAVFSLTHLTF